MIDTDLPHVPNLSRSGHVRRAVAAAVTEVQLAAQGSVGGLTQSANDLTALLQAAIDELAAHLVV